MTDRELMEAVAAGDSAAIRTLVDRYQKRIYKYLYGWLRNREDTLDLTQEVLLRICRKAHLYRPGQPLTPWVFRVSKNLFTDHLRRKNYKVHASTVDLEESIELQAAVRDCSPERGAHGTEVAGRVQSAIETLPRRQREVVQLRLLGELSLEEIATALGLTIGGVKSTLHNALRNLRRLLADLEEETHVKL